MLSGYDYAAFVKSKRKETRKYKPTAKQIETAKVRIEGVFRKYHGSIQASCRKALASLLLQSVHNRGRELGDYKKGEFAIVINEALDQLFDEKLVCEHDGWFGLMTRPTPARRRHHQKYPTQGRRRTRLAA